MKKTALYREEILELTFLLNKDLVEVKEFLVNNKIETKNGLLAAYVEGEDELELGVFITKNKEVVKFEKRKNFLMIEIIEQPKEIKNEFPQVLVALEMIED